MFTKSGPGLFSGLMLCALVTTPVAHAQDANTAAIGRETPTAGAPPGEPLEEVVVTGLSQRQSVQSAPVSTTVYTEAALQDARVTGPYDLIALTPSLSISQSQGVGVNMMTLRGISQVQNGQSPVAVVVDGVQEMDERQFVQEFYDTAQIEVLRGPQGDLWGRNAIGGALIINTREPTNDTHVTGGVTLGNGNTYKGQFSLLGPLIPDKLLYGIDVSDNHFGGLLDNVYLDRKADGYRELSARVHLKALITDDLTADLRGGLDNLDGGANNFHYQPAIYDPDRPCFVANPFGPFPGDANLVDRTFCANNRSEDNRRINTTSLRVVWEKPFATLSNVTAWSKVTEYLASDQFPYTASTSIDGVDGTTTQWDRQTSWEDEFRITSPSQGRFRWMVGGYYLSTRDYISRSTGLDTGNGIAAVLTHPHFDDPDNPTLSYAGNADHNDDRAAFAHLSYDITSALRAEFGFRYDWNNVHQFVDPASTFGVVQGCLQILTSACERSQSFNQGQPKATLSYRLNSDLTFFADYGIGFRSGGFNQSGTAVAAGLPGVRDMVGAEKANTAEVGFKSEWLDRRLTVNASLYDTIDRNPAYLLFVGAISAQVLVNVDQVRIVGGDVDMNYVVVPGLNVFGNAGYSHSAIDRYEVDPAVRGNRAPLVPDFNANLGVQYRHAIGRSLGGFGRFSVESHGREYWDPENSTARDAYSLYNMQLGVETLTRNLSLVLFVNNLTDKAYNANYVAGGFTVPAEPRTFGATLHFEF